MFSNYKNFSVQLELTKFEVAKTIEFWFFSPTTSVSYKLYIILESFAICASKVHLPGKSPPPLSPWAVFLGSQMLGAKRPNGDKQGSVDIF